MNDYTDSIDPNLPLVDQLVGEGRPFADYEALARSKVEANLHIRNVEQEQARLRADLETRMNYEEFLEHFREKAPTNAGNQTAPTGQTNPPPTTPTLADIERMLEQREQQKAKESNLNTALAKYAEVNGPNAALKLKQQATELGMTEDNLKNMAAANPKAFFKLTGVEETPRMNNNFEAPPRNQMNTSTFQSNLPPKNAEAEKFKELYRTNPSEYWKPAVQNQIYKAVAEGRVDPADVL
jgi:hypothetical protein